jgi:hypothetical protein
MLKHFDFSFCFQFDSKFSSVQFSSVQFSSVQLLSFYFSLCWFSLYSQRMHIAAGVAFSATTGLSIIHLWSGVRMTTVFIKLLC